MLNIINFEGYKSILCLNGDLPEASFFQKMKLPIIAADGAANKLNEIGIYPHLIAGDMDSVFPHILEASFSLHLANQESNDYQKALGYLAGKGLLPSIILGINGGCLDHVLNNVNLFIETQCLLYSPPIKGFVLKEKTTMNIILPIQTKISLMGIPDAIVSSKGLKWELNQSHLSFPGKTSCFNRTLLQKIDLEVHHGSVLVMIYEQMMIDAGVLS